MNAFIVTIDLDWACEPAIEETLDFLKDHNIIPTVFITHRSPRVEACMNELEVGLHPYFSPDSSHGSTIEDVVKHIIDLPHTIKAFRCHRFANCNASRQAMVEAGMLISSNICTDLQIVPPFRDRLGLLEVPIFLEDGGYLWRKHPLSITHKLMDSLLKEGDKVLLIHPMHFCLNTPDYTYMQKIKQSMKREEWSTMTKHTLSQLRWKQRGIRDLIIELLQIPHRKSSLMDLFTTS